MATTQVTKRDADTSVRIETDETDETDPETVDIGIDLDVEPTGPSLPCGLREYWEAETPEQKAAAKLQMHKHSARFHDRLARQSHHPELAKRHAATAGRYVQSAQNLERQLNRARRPVPTAFAPTTRARGAGRPAVRGSSKRSSARSGDSGSDDCSSDSDPDGSGTPSPQPCKGCGGPLEPGRRANAEYCQRLDCKRERARVRKASEREEDRLTNGSYAEYDEFDAWSSSHFERRFAEGCRCNGRHLVLRGSAGRCWWCGHCHHQFRGSMCRYCKVLETDVRAAQVGLIPPLRRMEPPPYEDLLNRLRADLNTLPRSRGVLAVAA